jgi:transcriptional regulator with XRE-family HTH domain
MHSILIEVVILSIGENIRRIRRIKDLTMKELATMVGVSEQGMGNYERGDREPNINMINKIAAALDVSVSELIGPPEDKSSPIKNLSSLAKVELSQIMSSENLKDLSRESLLLLDSQINQLVRQSDNKTYSSREGFLALCRFCGITIDLDPTEDGEVNEANIRYKNLEFNLSGKDYERLFSEVCNSIVKEVLHSQYY